MLLTESSHNLIMAKQSSVSTRALKLKDRIVELYYFKEYPESTCNLADGLSEELQATIDKYFPLNKRAKITCPKCGHKVSENNGGA